MKLSPHTATSIEAALVLLRAAVRQDMDERGARAESIQDDRQAIAAFTRLETEQLRKEERIDAVLDLVREYSIEG